MATSLLTSSQRSRPLSNMRGFLVGGFTSDLTRTSFISRDGLVEAVVVEEVGVVAEVMGSEGGTDFSLVKNGDGGYLPIPLKVGILTMKQSLSSSHSVSGEKPPTTYASVPTNWSWRIGQNG